MWNAAFKVPHSSSTALNPNEDFLLLLKQILTPATGRGIFECSHSGFYISFDVEKMCKSFLIVLRINIHVMDPKCEHTCKKVGIFFGAGNQ